MNTFFKTFFACLLAIFIHGIVSFFLILFLILGISSLFSAEESFTVKENSILRIDLGMEMPDSPRGNPLDKFDYSTFKVKQTVSLFDAISMIESAANDPRIKGIYLDIPFETPSSFATMYELRDALDRFRTQSGKFVVAFGDVYSQKTYYLSSCADKIFMNPSGAMEWSGMSSSVMFYKGLFDKLGIEPQIIRHGKFKGAVEPYMLEKMSPENRLQMQEMIDGLWGYMVQEIGKSRSIETGVLQDIASKSAMVKSSDAVRNKMIDEAKYANQVQDYLAELSGESTPRFVSLNQYKAAKGVSMGDALSKNQIAVVYANGDIVDSGDEKKSIVGNILAEELRKVRKDDAVKAVVLRVNSPGGSVIASDVIWNEVAEIKKVKPIIVSMGAYAASGGYYISCPADEIITTPVTLTGSIGVFGMMFNVEKGAREKLGLTVDVVKTNPKADMGSIFRSLASDERAIMQDHIDSTYSNFVRLVSNGRNMKYASVDSIGQGRIWAGLQAVNNGLADRIGTLKSAIQLAAEKASLADYKIKTYPQVDESLSGVLNSIVATSVSYMKSSTGLAPEVDAVKETIKKHQGVWAKIPYEIELN